MSRRRVIVAGMLVVALLAGAAALSALGVFGGDASSGDVPTYRVERADFVRDVLAEGNLESAQATLLTAPSGGFGPLKIAWLADDGSLVEEGDVVVRFDPTDMEKKLRDGLSERATTDSRIKQKEATENGAMRNLERDAGAAQLDLEYAREFASKDPEIFPRHEIIESEIDQSLASRRKDNAEYLRDVKGELAEVEIDLLGIERKKAELKIDQAEKELEELEIRAPHPGIFVLKETWGRVPAVGQMIWRNNPIGEIPKLDVMEAKVYVLEADAGGLETGLSATVRLDAHPGAVFEATVKNVDTLAKRRNRRVPVQYFGVTLELESTDPEMMKPGQRVEAMLRLGESADALAVPRQAVFEGENGSIVYVRRAGGFDPVEVTLGPAGLGRVVVESGLEPGDVVALRDPTRPLRGPDTGGDNEGNGVGVGVGP